VPEFLEVDPRTLHLKPTSFADDPSKLQRQIARHGDSTDGMPPIWVERGSDGELAIIDGRNRARRVAKLIPGTLVRVEVTEVRRHPVGGYPTIGDELG
jgi:hypothetical protein